MDPRLKVLLDLGKVEVKRLSKHGKCSIFITTLHYFQSVQLEIRTFLMRLGYLDPLCFRGRVESAGEQTTRHTYFICSFFKCKPGTMLKNIPLAIILSTVTTLYIYVYADRDFQCTHIPSPRLTLYINERVETGT